MRIHFLDEVHPVLVERLTAAGHACIAHDHPDAPVLDHCDGLVVRSGRVGQDVLDRAPGLRFVARVGSGLENIDTSACAARGVEVINSPEGNRDGVAEHTLLLVLALLKHLPRADRQVHAGQWCREENRGTDLHGLTVGIIGLGHMGLAFAERLQGFGVRVLGHDKYRSGHTPPHVEQCDLATLQRASDIVSLHLPLTDETHHYAGAGLLSGFARPIRLVNTSRGPVVHTAALLDALDSGRVLAAGLDVLEFERPDLSGLDPGTEEPVLERLLAHDRVILTPHIAGVTHEGRFKMAAVLADKILTRFPHAEP
ncbi:MAG TPA: NAD(P)-dependent oxidoreductase [Flavobacteriales bacterium]|nr:NAD(P)-dependent oxidoreductase [Flavobacteriales bacterium]HMR27693.1 NAD(P)-dependent oxidoreductase [Flavobacteriales bacterium]